MGQNKNKKIKLIIITDANSGIGYTGILSMKSFLSKLSIINFANRFRLIFKWQRRYIVTDNQLPQCFIILGQQAWQ